MSSRRNVLDPEKIKVKSSTNASLWLDKFIKGQKDPENKDSEKYKKELIKEITDEIKATESYELFYKRWKAALNKLENKGLQTAKAKVLGRMAVGLGGESVLETSIELHHTYGVPYIPGRALKGLTASYARQYLGDNWEKTKEKTSEAYKILFGTGNDNKTEQAGYVTFYDALYVPNTGHNQTPLHLDVMTVHHEDYYQNKDNAAPADWDNTNPIPFLAATGEYLIALSGEKEWVDIAFDILNLALKDLGVGAKTSSGYGRMEISRPLTPEIKELHDKFLQTLRESQKSQNKPLEVKEKQPQIQTKQLGNKSVIVSQVLRTNSIIQEDPIILAIKALTSNKFPGEVGNYIKQWDSITDTQRKLKVAKVLLEKADEFGRKKYQEKDWYKKLDEYVKNNPR